MPQAVQELALADNRRKDMMKLLLVIGYISALVGMAHAGSTYAVFHSSDNYLIAVSPVGINDADQYSIKVSTYNRIQEFSYSWARLGFSQVVYSSPTIMETAPMKISSTTVCDVQEVE